MTPQGQQCGKMHNYRNLYLNQLTKMVQLVTKYPLGTLSIVGFLTLVAGFFSATHLEVNSDRSGMIAPDTPFLMRYRDFQDAFPSYADTIIIVIDGEDTQTAVRAAQELHDALVERDDLFQTVFAPAAEPFFQDNAFLYMSVDELEDVADQLAEAQPALSALAEDPNLKGLFGLLDTALDAYDDGEDLPSLFVELMERIAETGDDLLAGKGSNLAWAGAFSGDGDDGATQLITVQGDQDFSSLTASRNAIGTIRQLAEDLDLTPENGVTVRMTGDVPLSDEEMQAVQDSVTLAGIVSVILISIILGYGIQSLRIITAILATLFVGLIWTLAWGLFSVGELNMISATFAVLFVGLGIDFSIHFALRFQESIDHGEDHLTAIVSTARGLGGALSLCAVSSAIGFISFIPTSYRAIADLGIISGGGMIMALIASITVLPALLALFGRPSKTNTVAQVFVDATQTFFERVGHHSNNIAIYALGVFVVAAGIASHTKFDYNTLTLKDQDSESLQTLQHLQDKGIATEYAVNILAPDEKSVEGFTDKLLSLPSVKEVETPDNFVPEDQDYKLDLIDETAFLLWPILTAENEPEELTDQDRFTLVSDLVTQITTMRFRVEDTDLYEAATRLVATLQELTKTASPAQTMQAFERHLTADIEEPLDFLRTALQTEGVIFDDLPDYVKERVIAKDGRVQIVGLPADDITEFESMRNFVDEVSAVFPEATGRPIVEAGVGDLVVDSFWTAITLALSAIMMVLFITVRKPSDVALILAPLLMAAALTIATGVIFNLPLNQANIIVIPLILGLGVDNGIHVVMRFHEDGSMTNLMASSTPRAVILSTLTTLGTFGALSLSIHQGIQSMGILLAISMLYLLVCTIVVLPALLYWRASHVNGVYQRA